jgi:multidrug transporter EmrE-like cation transporter
MAVTLSVIALTLVLNVLANVFLKVGMQGAGGIGAGALIHMLRTPSIYAGVFCYGVAFVTYSLILTRINLSVAYPMMTGGIATGVAIVAALFFGEPLTLFRIGGIGLIVSGIWLLSR